MPIFADYHRTVVGYHGTRRREADRIVREADVPRATGKDEAWQGRGVYFWEYGPRQAWAWARDRYGDDVGVVASMIRLGNCLDLLDPENALWLASLHQEYAESLRQAGRPMPRNVRGRKRLDFGVLEYAYDYLERERRVSIDSCRAVYVPSRPARLWPHSWMCHDTHVQLCVRDPSCVLGTWLVKPIME